MKTSKNRFEKIATIMRSDLLNQPNALSQQSVNAIREAIDAREMHSIYQSGYLSPQEVAVVRQFNEIDAKLTPARAEHTADRACWLALADAQERCASQNEVVMGLSWNKKDSTLLNILLIAAGLLDEASSSVEENLGPNDQGLFLWSDWHDDLVPFKYPITGFDIGPGVCANTEHTDTVCKFEKGGLWCNSMIETPRLERIQHAIVCDVLDNSLGLKNLELTREVRNAVVGSYAPKKKDISRFIAPQLNGDLYLQYPMAHFMTHMLGYFGINLEKQPDINRECARQGSLYDGYSIPLNDIINVRNRKPQWCTLDLTSASEIVGLSLGHMLFPSWIFTYMMATRCSNVIDPHTNEFLRLENIATMGNAFCFPMQTLVFVAIAKAVNIVLGMPANWVHVFGDDIIVDRKAYPYLVEVLRSLKMVPNIKKSFSDGHFRESCGGDYYKGYQVRPVSPREYNNLADVYSVTNALLDWYEEHNLVMGKLLARALADDILYFHRKFNTLRNKKLKGRARHELPFFLVPRFANMSDGVRISSITIAVALSNKTRTGNALSTTFDLVHSDYLHGAPLFGQWNDDLQTQVTKYSYLKLEPTYRPLQQEELQQFHCTKVSGRWTRVDKKKSETSIFSVAGRSTGRAVQRRSVIPSNQWSVNPEGSPYYTSLYRQASEMRLLSALVF